MVERLKVAVEKARALRGGERNTTDQSPAVPTTPDAVRTTTTPEPVNSTTADRAWADLQTVTLDERHLENHRVITRDKKDPAYIAFDVLRTRIMRVFQKNGWTRIGITSPTKGCGKTFVSANLALSMSRAQNNRTILVDMDLRLPALSKVLGVRQSEPARWFLSGEASASDYLRLAGPNLAVGVNTERVRDAAEVIMDDRTGKALKAMEDRYKPDIVVYDLPPMLSCDDVMGFLPNLDCILLVAAGDRTRPDSVTECERLLADQTHLLGVLLNKAQSSGTSKYGYEYGYGYT